MDFYTFAAIFVACVTAYGVVKLIITKKPLNLWD